MLKLDNVAVGDDYTAAATLEDVYASTGGYFAVYNADCFVELQYGRHGQEWWTNEVRAPIGNGVLAPGTIGVRFRNAVAGSTATVSAALSAEAEPPLAIVAGGNSQSPTLAGASSIPIAVSAAGSTTLVAAVAGLKTEVLAVALMSAGVNNVKFQRGTVPTDVTGVFPLIASTGFVLGPGGVWFATGANEALLINTTTVTTIGGVLTYKQVPA